MAEKTIGIKVTKVLHKIRSAFHKPEPENAMKITNQNKQEDLDNRLMKAARDGNNPEISRLLDLNASILAKNDFGMTTLMSAAMGGHTEACALLLETISNKGGNIKLFLEISDKDGWTALKHAAFNHHAKTAEFLRSYGTQKG